MYSLMSEVDRGERSASRPGLFILGDKSPAPTQSLGAEAGLETKRT
jgi:hypothetical protein